MTPHDELSSTGGMFGRLRLELHREMSHVPELLSALPILLVIPPLPPLSKRLYSMANASAVVPAHTGIQARLQATATIFIFIFNPSANQEHLTQTLRVVYVELPATHPALVSR